MNIKQMNDDIYNEIWWVSNDDIYTESWQLGSDGIYNDDASEMWILEPTPTP